MHATSQVKRIVYSTCSVNVEENEDVVASALAADSARRQGKAVGSALAGGCDIQYQPGWILVKTLQTWPRRGVPGSLSHSEAAKCVRFNAEKDLCLGFFIACFERIVLDGP